MKGRYEKPKQKRFGKTNQPRNEYPSQRGGAYPGGGYSNGSGYSYDGNMGYPNQGGYYDENGYPVYPGAPAGGPAPVKEKGGFGWGLLGFLLPLVGLIIFLVSKRSRPRKAKAAGIGALVGLIFTIVLVCAAFFGLRGYVNGMLDNLNQVEVNVSYTEPVVAAPTEPVEVETEPVETTEPPHVASREDYINFLVVGQSSRGEGDKEQARFADSMMLLTLNTYEKTLTMTSLLRDTFVQPPNFRGHDFGRIKLTTVYHLGSFYDNGNIAGSMEFIDLTLFKNFGIEVDHNFEVDFDIFTRIVDLLGGITVTMDQAEADYMNKEIGEMVEVWGAFEPGENHLEGFTALAFARMRHAEGDADSDIKRTSRQQAVVKAILDKVRTKSIPELQNLVKKVLPMVSTSMSTDEITKMVMNLLPMLPELKLVSGGTCPANYWGEMVDIYKDGFKHSVLRFDENETKEYMRELTLGEVPASGKSRLPKATEPAQATEPGKSSQPVQAVQPAAAPTPTAAPAPAN